MIPIHELLNRILWDKAYGSGDFKVGYYDRVVDEIIRVPFKNISFEKDNHYCIEVYDSNGETHTVPLHRIKEVHKDGELIWHREH